MYTHIYIQIHINAHIYACLYTHINMHIYDLYITIHTYISNTFAHLYPHLYLSVYTIHTLYLNIHIHIYTCIYTYIYTYTHILFKWSFQTSGDSAFSRRHRLSTTQCQWKSTSLQVVGQGDPRDPAKQYGPLPSLYLPNYSFFSPHLLALDWVHSTSKRKWED